MTPNRSWVMIAKLLAAASLGLGFGTAGFGAATAVAMVFVGADGYRVALSAGTIFGYGAGSVLAAGLLAAVDVGLGTLIRSQLAAVIGVLIWGFFVESIVGGVFNASCSRVRSAAEGSAPSR